MNNGSRINVVEVGQVEKVRQDILQRLDIYIAHYRPLIGQSDDGWSYYDGKVEAAEMARRLVNAALYDLCFNLERRVTDE